MIANAKRWAASKGLVRTNPVHGLEEMKIPTKESFKFTNEQLQRSRVSGSFEAEDRMLQRKGLGAYIAFIRGLRLCGFPLTYI